MSEPPPIATPSMLGGQGLLPALVTVSMTNFLSPFMPSPGTSMPVVQTFSEPPPLGITVISIWLPWVISQCVYGMFGPVLSPVFLPCIGSTAFGRSGICVVAFRVAFVRACWILWRFGVWAPALM